MSTSAFLERYRTLMGTAESPGHRAASGVVPIVLGGLILAAGVAGAVALYSQPAPSARGGGTPDPGTLPQTTSIDYVHVTTSNVATM